MTQQDILLTIAAFLTLLLWANKCSFRVSLIGFQAKTKRVPGLATLAAWLASLAPRLKSMPQGELHGSMVPR